MKSMSAGRSKILIIQPLHSLCTISQLADDMTAVDERINSKKSAAQQAEDIKQAATSTAEETRQNS